jgi:phosphoserine phosphatase
MLVRPLVVFDMDGVLVQNRSSWRVIHEAIGTSNEESFQAYIRGEIDDEEFMERDISLWKEKGIHDRSQLIDSLAEAKRVDGLMKCIRDLKIGGCEIAIISGGLDLLADRLGKELDIGHIEANGVEVREDGRLTGKGILKVPLRDKGSVLRSMVKDDNGFHPVIAVGDSAVDITMFEEADLSIAFNPESELVSGKADVTVTTYDLGTVSGIVLKWLEEGSY